MYYLKLPQMETQNLSFYLAVEEYAARFLKQEPIFFYWQVNPSVIVGRNQCLQKEVNLEYCREHNINVYRRKSGGGCVYADKNNVMLAYIAGGNSVMLTYSSYINLIVSALRRMHINADITGRNDILVDGGKVSGTAFYHIQDRNVVHGTLLYDTNMQNMVASITPSNAKLVAKGVESVRSRINLLKDYTDLTLSDIKKGLVTLLCNEVIELDDNDIVKIREIEKSYVSDDFIQGNRKSWNLIRKARIEGCGDIEIDMHIKRGRVTSCRFYGDFFLLKESCEALEHAISGVELSEKTISEVLQKYPPQNYIRGLNRDGLLNLIFEK